MVHVEHPARESIALLTQRNIAGEKLVTPGHKVDGTWVTGGNDLVIWTTMVFSQAS